MLQLQRQLLKQQQQVKKAASKQLPPKGGSSAGSVKATAQRVGTAVKQKIQQDMTVTRALADNIRRNSERTARQIKPDASPKVRYSGSNGPNPKPRNLPPVTKPVRSGSSAVTTPPKPRQPRGGQLATQGRGPLGGQRALPPGVKGGGIEKAGQTIDVKANSGKAPTSKPTPAGTGASQASPPRGSGSPLPNSARRGGNLPRAGAKAIRGRVADVRPATPSAPNPKLSAPTAKPSASVPPASAAAKPQRPTSKSTSPKPSASSPTASADAANWLKSKSPEAAAARAVAQSRVIKAAKLGGRALAVADLAITAKSVFNPKDNIITRARDLGTAIENTQAKPGQKKQYVSQNDSTKKANAKIQADNNKNKPRPAEYKRPKANISKPSAARAATQQRDYKKLKDFG